MRGQVVALRARLSGELLATSPDILESGPRRAAHLDCTNAISMTVKNKGGRFTNSAIGTGGADTHIENEPSALLIRAMMMVSGEMGGFQRRMASVGLEMENR